VSKRPSIAAGNDADNSGTSLFKFGMESLETAAVQVLGVLIGIPMLAITARWLGPAGRGDFVTTTTWAALAATCCGLSLGLVAIHEMTKTSGLQLKALLGTLLVMAIVLSLTAWGGIAAVFRFERSAFGNIELGTLALAFTGVPFLVSRDYFGSLLIAEGRVPVWNRSQALGSLLSLGLAGLFAVTGTLSVGTVILAWLAGQVVVCSISYVVLYGGAGGLKINLEVAQSLLRGGYKLHLNAIGAIVISSIDVLMVNSFVGAHEVGYYQLALKLVTNVALIAQAVGTVTYGRIVKFGPDAAWPLVRKICAATMALIMFGTFLAAWLAPLLVRVIGGRSFGPSVRLFRMMLLAIPGLSLSYLMAPQWICRGFFWQAGAMTLFSAAISALANRLLVPRYGAEGAAISYIGIYFISMIVNGAMFLFCEWHWRVKSRDISLHQPATLYQSERVAGS
jgi:O-antigen/teichoic acid export membrane protein